MGNPYSTNEGRAKGMVAPDAFDQWQKEQMLGAANTQRPMEAKAQEMPAAPPVLDFLALQLCEAQGNSLSAIMDIEHKVNTILSRPPERTEELKEQEIYDMTTRLNYEVRKAQHIQGRLLNILFHLRQII
jgi:hypothetical protein